MKGRLLLLLKLLLPVWAEGDPPQGDCLQNLIIAFEGKDTVLKPVVDGTPTDITWKKGENIVYEWDSKSDNSNGNYTIKNTSHSDDGLYTAEIIIGDNKIEYRHFCLKTLEYLEPPVVYCSDRSDDIQVNCTSPPQIYSHNLSVSYHWEDRGKVFDHGKSITLQKDESLPEKITCVIHIYNVHINNSIMLSKCRSKEPDPGRSRLVLWILLSLLLVVVVMALFGFWLWKKGHLTCWKRKNQEDTGNANVPLNEMSTNDGPRGVSEDSNDNRREGNDEGVPLNETPDDSKGVPENSKDDGREGNSTIGKT